MPEASEIEEYGKYLQSQGVNDSDIQGYTSYLRSQMGEATKEDVFAQAVSKMQAQQSRDPSGKILDYPGSVARAAVLGPIEQMTGGIEKGQPSEELKTALMGGGSPSVSERLGRTAEMEPGAVRGTLGFIGDVLTDPIAGVTKVAKKGLGAMGKAIYKSPTDMVKLDNAVVKFGKEPVSDLLLKYGVTGNMRTIAKKSGKIADDLAGQRKSILGKADATGMKIDLADTMRPVYEEAKDLLLDADPKVVEAGQDLMKKITAYMIPGTHNFVSPSKLSAMKSELYTLTNKSTWDIAKQTTRSAKVAKKMGLVMKEATEKAVDKATKEGGLLKKVNEEWGTLLSAGKTMTSAAGREAARPGVTQIDGMLGLMAASGNPMAIAAMTGKTAVKMGRLPGVRTKVGKMLHGGGTEAARMARDSGTLGKMAFDTATRRGLIKLMEER